MKPSLKCAGALVAAALGLAACGGGGGSSLSKVVSASGKVVSEAGAVSVKSDAAALAGLEMLEKGGNAVDAMVATALVTDVTGTGDHSLGGYGGAMMIHLKKLGKPVVVDFNTRAPLAMTPSYFASTAELTGFSVKTIMPWPGVAGLHTALTNYGTMKWEDVIAPAIRAAEDGFVLTEHNARDINRSCAKVGNVGTGKFQQSPASMAIYCPTPAYKAGDLFKQPDLAKTLRTLATEGPAAIYTGSIGKAMVSHLQAAGNLVSMADNEDWQKRYATIREPAATKYRGYDVYTSPINSGGVTLIGILNLLNGFDLGSTLSAGTVHLMMESYKAAFTDRLEYAGDPTISPVPYFGLTSQRYADERRKVISATAVPASYPVGNPWAFNDVAKSAAVAKNQLPYGDNGTHTAHQSVIDKEGNMVSMTQTMRDTFGSGITIPGTGITMNNGSGVFVLDPAHPNGIKGGKQPLNNMAAYLIMKDGKPFVASGAAGGRAIITQNAFTIVKMIDFGMDIHEAIQSPLFHCEAVESSCAFEPAFDAGILGQLRAMGHVAPTRDPAANPIGIQHGAMIDPKTGMFIAGRDSRSDASRAAGFTGSP